MRAILPVLDFRLQFARSSLSIRRKYDDGRGSEGGWLHGVGLVGRDEGMTNQSTKQIRIGVNVITVYGTLNPGFEAHPCTGAGVKGSR